SDYENREVLVVLPTGTGKSGLISIAPFGVCRRRTLIITPGIVTKNSVVKTLHPLDSNFLVEREIIFNEMDLPTIEEYSSEMLRSSLEQCHVVITNVHRLQDRDSSLLKAVDKNFFDFI